MNSLIDAATVQTIRSTGNTRASLPDRIGILDAYNLPYDRTAENVIITGCQILSALPGVLQTLTRIMDRGGISYTFLSKEYCCGNELYRPAIKAKNDEAMAECRSLSKEFVGLNIQKAQELGARRIVIFCSPCYPIYRHAFPEEEIIFYPRIIEEAMPEMDWSGEIDYYAGCYRLHRKFAPVPMDLTSTDSVLNKIHGLSVNRISAPSCCFKADGLSHMIGSVKTQTMVHICTGCYFQAISNMPGESRTQVFMLPDFIDRVQNL